MLTIKESAPGIKTTTYTQSKHQGKSTELEARAFHDPMTFGKSFHLSEFQDGNFSSYFMG